MDKNRTMQYTARSAAGAVDWQKKVRRSLFSKLKIDDLLSGRHEIALNPKEIGSERKTGYTLTEMEINSTLTRRMSFVISMPFAASGSGSDEKHEFPAVVCIHGHGGGKRAVYDTSSQYKGFADALAKKEYITISAEVGQHEVYEEGRILMGERLWDLMRCVDYLDSLFSVDHSAIGCAGLSLGGEMAMWLGAMDERIAATVSAGFLTTMDQMEKNHCMCWKFPGLREKVDYADIYSLHAPHPLECQNGEQEGPTQFYVPIAAEAMKEINLIYSDLGCSELASLVVHRGGHEIELSSLLAFFDKYLG